MPKVVVSLPRLLEPAVGRRTRIEVEADTVGQAIGSLLRELPALRVHLFNEEGELRPHVLCFVDGSASRLQHPDQPVSEELSFLQAVSGG